MLDEGEGNMKECVMRVLIRLPGVRDLWHVHTLHEREPASGSESLRLGEEISEGAAISLESSLVGEG